MLSFLSFCLLYVRFCFFSCLICSWCWLVGLTVYYFCCGVTAAVIKTVALSWCGLEGLKQRRCCRAVISLAAWFVGVVVSFRG